MAKRTNVIEWVNPGPDDILYVYPYEDLRWGTIVIVHEYEAAIFMRDGKLYDVLRPGRHKLSTQNLPLLTKAYSKLMGYGETPFKAKIIFVSLKQFKGKFGLNTRIPLSQQAAWLTELRAFGEYWFRVSDPVLFLTQVSGAVTSLTTNDVTNFIRSFFVESLMQELAKYNAMLVYSKLGEITNKIKSGTLYYAFKQRGLELLDLKFSGVSLPLLEKMEKEDPTYGLPLISALQSGNEAKVLELIRAIESAKALGKVVSVPMAMPFTTVPYPMLPQQLQQPQQAQEKQTQAGEASKQKYFERLKELKQMLDAGLITQEEYEKVKNEILAELQKVE